MKVKHIDCYTVRADELKSFESEFKFVMLPEGKIRVYYYNSITLLEAIIISAYKRERATLIYFIT